MRVILKKLLPFEKHVLAGLALCGIDSSAVSDKNPLGIAVSGGADSLSLLLALSAIFPQTGLRVITVDHGIRAKEESGGDAAFVADMCARLGVLCRTVAFPAGEIAEVARSEGKSVEETARNFRYEAFEAFISAEGLCALCLAHNQNDQLETVLMRFLQGSAAEGMGGIARTRGSYARPLLDIPRSEIEAYLREKNVTWRTDSTNADTVFLRNRIRNMLAPVLSEHFVGWQGAVLLGAKKAAHDEDFLRVACADFLNDARFCAIRVCEAEKSRLSEVSMKRNPFYALHDSLKRRVFFSAVNKIGFGGRFPFRLFEEIASWQSEKSREVRFENMRVCLDSENLVISLEHYGNLASDSSAALEGGFSFLFSACGERAEIGTCAVQAGICEKDGASEGSRGAELVILTADEKIAFPVVLPVLVRSYITGDKIKAANGSLKSLAHIFSDWKMPERLREKVFVVEELRRDSGGESPVRALVASHLGFKNWIVV